MIVLSGLEPKTYLVTPEGMQELQEQLDDLKRRRREAAEAIREMASQTTDMGSRIDSTFAANRNDASELDAEIGLLERIIALADIIETPDNVSEVRVGSRVTVQLDGKQQTYRLVGVIEADPGDGKISNESPLGKSLLGKRGGESFEIVTPAGNHTPAKVVDIE